MAQSKEHEEQPRWWPGPSADGKIDGKTQEEWEADPTVYWTVAVVLPRPDGPEGEQFRILAETPNCAVWERDDVGHRMLHAIANRIAAQLIAQGVNEADIELAVGYMPQADGFRDPFAMQAATGGELNTLDRMGTAHPVAESQAQRKAQWN